MVGQLRTALLDTSAFKALGHDALSAALEQGWRLTTSPWCFFELLCHLDEEEDFAKAKGQLMKFRGVEIVDKPLDRAVAEMPPSIEPRVWSSDLCYAALGAINAAQSLDDLKHSILVDEAGKERGPLKDLAGRVRGALADAEREFRTHMSATISALSRGDLASRTDDQNHSEVLSMLTGGGLPLPDTAGLDYSAVDVQLALKYGYCFWSYFLHQAIALAKCGARTCQVNDLEDGQLCGYVSLDKQVWVVTADRALRERLTQTHDVLAAVGSRKRALFEAETPDILRGA